MNRIAENATGERIAEGEAVPAASPAMPMALRPKAAAKALGISERLLWSKTNAGEIPHCRIGKAILYPIPVIEKWLVEQVAGGSHDPD